MTFEEVKTILESYHSIVVFDEGLKLYKMFWGAGFSYVTEQEMKDFDLPGFKQYIINESIKDSIMHPYITLQ